MEEACAARVPCVKNDLGAGGHLPFDTIRRKARSLGSYGSSQRLVAPFDTALSLDWFAPHQRRAKLFTDPRDQVSIRWHQLRHRYSPLSPNAIKGEAPLCGTFLNDGMGAQRRRVNPADKNISVAATKRRSCAQPLLTPNSSTPNDNRASAARMAECASRVLFAHCQSLVVVVGIEDPVATSQQNSNRLSLTPPRRSRT